VSAVRNPTYQAATYQAIMDRRFKAAARHSARVRLMRWVIPLVVVLALLAIIAASVFNPFRILTDLPINMDNVVVSGTRITMESPRLAGFTPDQRPYEVAAKAATQDLTAPDRVELREIHAKVTLEDRSLMTLDALDGKFDTKSQLLDLKNNIFLQSSTGYEAKLSSAVVDIAAGNVSSDEPVWVKLLNGTLDANRLRITNRGEVVRFDGGVSMTLMLDTPSPDAAQAPSQTDGAGMD
jgi:lipopolysaccharide export system protein LptC